MGKFFIFVPNVSVKKIRMFPVDGRQEAVVLAALQSDYTLLLPIDVIAFSIICDTDRLSFSFSVKAKGKLLFLLSQWAL